MKKLTTMKKADVKQKEGESMKLILFGPNGSGKGTLGGSIVKDFGIPNISSGDIFRKNIKEQTPLGIKAEGFVKSGALVPDELTIDMFMDRLSNDDCKKGYILDGFPRTIGQAKALDKKVKEDIVIELDVATELIMQRLAGRWTDKVTGEIWNERYEGFAAAKAKGNLFQRDDDKPEVVAKRLQEYYKNNKAILEFYRGKGTLFTVKIDKECDPQETYKTVKEHLNKFKAKKKGREKV